MWTGLLVSRCMGSREIASVRFKNALPWLIVATVVLRADSTCVVCTVDILPVWVSHRLRLPSVSPIMTRWPQAAIAVATPSDELLMRPHDGRFGFVSVTCKYQLHAELSFACEEDN